MFEADQKIRRAYYNWFNVLWKSAIGKRWEKLNREQVERIAQISRTIGFPGEKLIGIDQTTFHPKANAVFSAGMPIVILIHHFSQPNPSYDELFLAELLKGNLHNQHFATVCDFQAKYGQDRYSHMGPYGINFRQEEKVSSYNPNRQAIGLPPIGWHKEATNNQTIITEFWTYFY